MAKTVFPVAEGIEVQQAHLALWAQVLKPEVMERLRLRVERDNCRAVTGWDVCRGDAIYEILANRRW